MKVSQSSGDKNSYWINLLRYLRYLSQTIWDCVGVTLNKSTSTCIKPTQPKFLTTGSGHLEIVANAPFYVHQILRIQRGISAFWFVEFSLFGKQSISTTIFAELVAIITRGEEKENEVLNFSGMYKVFHGTKRLR